MERERIEEIQRAYSDAEELIEEIERVNTIEEINDLIDDYEDNLNQNTGWFTLEKINVKEDEVIDEHAIADEKETIINQLKDLLAWVEDVLG